MVKLWRREPNLPQFTLGADPVTALATSPDGKAIATAGAGNVVRLWDSATGKPLKELAGHTGNAAHVENEETKWHPDIFICRGLRKPLDQLWPQLIEFG